MYAPNTRDADREYCMFTHLPVFKTTRYACSIKNDMHGIGTCRVLTTRIEDTV